MPRKNGEMHNIRRQQLLAANQYNGAMRVIIKKKKYIYTSCDVANGSEANSAINALIIVSVLFPRRSLSCFILNLGVLWLTLLAGRSNVTRAAQ